MPTAKTSTVALTNGVVRSEFPIETAERLLTLWGKHSGWSLADDQWTLDETQHLVKVSKKK